MALTRGTVGRGSLTAATEEIAYDSRDHATVTPDATCTGMRVRCTHATVGCFVRIPGLHAGVAVGAGVYLPPLDEIGDMNDANCQIFRMSGGIDRMYISGDGALSTVEWGPVEHIA